MTSDTKPLSLAEALRAARETKALEIGSGILAETPRVFRGQFGSQPAVIIADPNTWRVAGDAVSAAFRKTGHPCEPPLILRDPELYAEHRFVLEVETALHKHAAIPVAVGSGTINDLTKLAAHYANRPYMCVATAASMDGYTAFGASITHEGSKQTFNCPAPVAVLADLEVIRAAPPEMTASGYADLLAKVTAGADWIVADALGAEPIDHQAWDIVQGGLQAALADPAGVRAGEPEAIGRLTEGLMLGGFAMQAAKTSRPASGAEHQFSHLWDMQHHTHNGQAPSHGFKVAIGTFAVTALYERLLNTPLENLDMERCCEAWPDGASWERRVNELFSDAELQRVARQEIRAKACDAAALRTQLNRLRTVWPQLRARLHAQLISSAELKRRLQAVGAPTEPEQIGITRERLRDSFWRAFFIRRRFTVLDLAVRADLLNECLDNLFSPTGPWPPTTRSSARTSNLTGN